VEFALLVPLLLLVLLTAVEVATTARTQLEVVAAAREGAREAAVSPDPARALAAARDALGEAGERARITVSRPHVVGEPAKVTVRLPYRLGMVPFGGITIELTGTATMRVER
jgi:Flp pilus assembly protein TadG